MKKKGYYEYENGIYPLKLWVHIGKDLKELIESCFDKCKAHVGAADTGSDHADQNIVFLVDLRLLEINDLQFIRFNDLNALHKIFLLKSDNGLKDFDDLSARWADGSGPC